MRIMPVRIFLDWAAMLNMFANGDFAIGWAVSRAQWSVFSRFGFWWKKRKVYKTYAKFIAHTSE
jgi:hypothetical protein